MKHDGTLVVSKRAVLLSTSHLGGSFGGIAGGSNDSGGMGGSTTGGGGSGVNNNLNSLEVPTSGNGGRDFLADIHHDIELRELGGGSGGAGSRSGH